MAESAERLAELEARNAWLEAQLAVHREALEHMHPGVCMFDDDGVITLCNRRYAEILRLPPGSLRPGMTGRDIIRLGMEAGHYPPGKSLEEIERDIKSNFGPVSRAAGRLVRGGRTYSVDRRKTASDHIVSTCDDITEQVEAQNALQESEARLQAILDAMPDCVKIFNEAGQLIYINPRGLQLLQAPDLESLSREGYIAVPPEYLDDCIDVHRRVIAGEAVVWIYEVIGLEGRRCHVEAHAVPFRMPDGAKVHLCISRDVNERHEAHEAVRRSEERLRLVQEVTGLADFEADARGKAYFSPHFLEQMGLPADSATALAFEDWLPLVHPDDRDRLREVERSLETVDTSRTEFRIRRADNGEIRWIASYIKIERDDAGQIIRSIGAHHDITDRKLAEEELRASERRLRLVQDATGLADFESDSNGLSVCSNRFFEQLGLPVGDSTVGMQGWVDRLHPDDKPRVIRSIEEALDRQDEWFQSEFRIVRADNGETRWLACNTKMERDERGNLVRTIGAHLDITERKEAENALRRSEERLRLVQEATGLADFEAGQSGTILVSELFAQQTGLPPGTREITHQGWVDIIHPDDREEMSRVVAACLESEEAVQHEFRIVRPDSGEVRWISSRTRPEFDGNGRPIRTIGAHLDITEHKLAAEALRESEERFRLAAEAAGLGVWDYDVTTKRREWSERLRQIMGVGPEVEPGLAVAEACIHPADRERFQKVLQNARDSSLARFEATCRIRRLDDRAERWIAMNGWRIHGSDNRLHRIIVTVRDVTAEKTAEARVRWSASHDALTRLANRSLFQERLDGALEQAAESGRAVGVMLLDMDHFKQINDSLGHDAGDMLLKMFAKRLRGVVRHCDTVARFGGDEFAVVLPELDGEHSLLRVSRAIQQRLREPFVHAGRILDCRVSIGASLYPRHGKTADELLKNADIALYAAKGAGRGLVTVFEPHMRDNVQRRISMVQQARHAIEDDRVVPYYQPKLDLATGSLVGFEALLRWRHPNGRISSPGAIEAAFEDSDVAAQISDRMIERVIANMRTWLDRGIEFGSVAVNASAAEFRRDNFAERVLEQLRRADIPTRHFQLEITETVFLGRGAEYVHRALALMNMRGIRIALDDFGTGYASLRHLKQFPVDLIKIDQSFVKGMAVDPNDDAIVRAVINLGRSLGIKIVAEGIETEEQARRLVDLECDFGQGFLFSRAVPASRVPALVERWPVRAEGSPRSPVDLRLVANRD